MKASVNGISVDYSLEGKKGGLELVLIHGFPFSRAMWAPQIAALKKNYRVLSYDLRGLGKSRLGKAPQPLEAYVDDLLLLIEKLKLKAPILCGLSMGGYIALRAVEREPGRFRALALCDTRADADQDVVKLRRAAGIKALREKGVTVYCKAMLPGLLAKGAAAPAAKGLLKIMMASKADGMANALSAMAGRTDCSAALRDFKIPLLIMVGDQDQLTPPELARAMSMMVERANFSRVPEAGHVSNLDNPGAFNSQLLSFLAGLKA